MKLAAAASFFDRMSVYDAYTGRLAFKAQLGLFDDSQRDAINILRRTMSAAPGIVIPPRRAVVATGVPWVVSALSHPDEYDSQTMRVKYTLQRAHGLAVKRTPGEVIGNTAGVSAYAGLSWMKDWKEAEYTSKVHPYYELYFALSEPIAADDYIELDGKIFRVRAVYGSEAGFKVAESDELGAARVSVTYKPSGAYNPATDTYSGSPVTVPALNVRYAADFEYEQPSAPKREAGDLVLLVRKSDVPVVNMNDELTLSSRLYRVITKQSEQDCWNLTVRT